MTPRAIKHWLDHAISSVSNETVIVLLEVDFLFVRPISLKFREEQNLLFNTKGQYALKSIEDIPLGIQSGSLIIINVTYSQYMFYRSCIWRLNLLGSPVGQQYPLGAPWTNDNHKDFNRGKICGEGSLCLKQKGSFAAQHFSIGPPVSIFF